MRVAVVIASYGAKNAKHLQRVLEEWHTMADFTVEVTVVTEAALPAGAPPQSLPFYARTTLAENLNRDFDLFVYSEDDILITQRNLRAWVQVNPGLALLDVPGFLRYEIADPSGERRFPDMHGAFHWQNLERHGDQLFAEFSNAHSGCYVLTGWELRQAMASGGYLVKLHEDATYGALERGASDIYLQCGLRRLIPLSRFEEFLVHHLPDSYLHLGKPEAAVREELKAMGVEWK